MNNSLRHGAATLSYGVSQIFFQTKVVPGILILAAFAVASWQMALLVAIGSAGSSVGGLLLRVPPGEVRNGHQGFCGALAGAAAFVTVGGGWFGAFVALLGGLACAPVTWAVVRVLETPRLKSLRLPYTTAPFCIVGGLMYFATVGHHANSETGEINESLEKDFFRSILTNISQVVLVESFVAGGLILLALFIAHWKVGLAAVLGSTIQSFMAIFTQRDAVDLSRGLIGYSGVLVAIAMATVFLKGTWQPWFMAVVGTLMAGGITVVVEGWSGVFTWPYVLTTWFLLALAHFIPGLKRA
ncbi:MAG: urea transporter [Specibacter sp.]